MKTTLVSILTLLTLSLLSGSKLPAQITEKKTPGKLVITGIVYDKETREPLSNALFSINNNSYYTTNELGRFLIRGNPGDTITYSYVGYQRFNVLIPDTLAALEYLLGIFMTKDTILIPEIVIFPRTYSYPSIVNRNEVTREMIERAQINVNRAVYEGLTRPVTTYDADMNAKQTLRIYQMKAQYKGLVVTPENSVGVSNQSFRTYHLLYGSPISTVTKVSKEMITPGEAELIIGQYLSRKAIPPSNAK